MSNRLKFALEWVEKARGNLDSAESLIKMDMEFDKEFGLKNVEAAELPQSNPCPWLDAARGELGVKEVRGSEHNPRILQYLASTTIGKWGASRDETAWCSAFVNWCMQGGGQWAEGERAAQNLTAAGFHEGTGSAMARSWLGWGVELKEPRHGCVVVFSRGKPPSGHVAFCDMDANVAHHPNFVRVLGGNQSNAVSHKVYKRDDVLGYRWPADASGGE